MRARICVFVFGIVALAAAIASGVHISNATQAVGNGGSGPIACPTAGANVTVTVGFLPNCAIAAVTPAPIATTCAQFVSAGNNVTIGGTNVPCTINAVTPAPVSTTCATILTAGSNVTVSSGNQPCTVAAVTPAPIPTTCAYILSAGTGITVTNTNQPCSVAATGPTQTVSTWTPTDQSGAGLSITVNSANYIKTGRLVYMQFDVTYPTTANALAASLSLPSTTANFQQSCNIGYNGSATALSAYLPAGYTSFLFIATTSAAGNYVNSTLSGARIIISCTYESSS